MWRNIPLTVSKGVAGICPAYANSNYVVKELVGFYTVFWDACQAFKDEELPGSLENYDASSLY